MEGRRSPQQVLRDYFEAKDGNRPELMRAVFCADAQLHMQLRSQAIAFPARTHGLEAITDVLVRQFAQRHRDVRSFYLGTPPGRVGEFSCGWLVGMVVREDGGLRVGCGRYRWVFQDEAPGLACRLDIAIEAMEAVPAESAAPVDAWLGGLRRPWVPVRDVLEAAPRLPALAPVLRRLDGSTKAA
jgi:hypothetical protein